MTESERSAYRRLLETKEAELQAGFRRLDRIVIEKAADEVDEMMLAQERDFAIRGLDREAALLREVRAALDRLADGTYGTCLKCDEEISATRMAAVPWAAYCRACQEAIDTNGEPLLVEPLKRSRPSIVVSAVSRRPLSDAA